MIQWYVPHSENVIDAYDGPFFFLGADQLMSLSGYVQNKERFSESLKNLRHEKKVPS